MSKFSPAHYQQGSIDVWDFIIDQQLNYLDGCMIKYICRAGAKEGESRLDDLLKVKAYITKAVFTELNNDLQQNTRPNGSSDSFPNGNVPADCYDEYNSPYDAAMFDR